MLKDLANAFVELKQDTLIQLAFAEKRYYSWHKIQNIRFWYWPLKSCKPHIFVNFNVN